MVLGIDVSRYGLLRGIVDHDNYGRSVARSRANGVVLPTFAQLADPSTIPARVTEDLSAVTRSEPHPLNLFRVHWHNSSHERPALVPVPDHLVLPRELTGVDARIVMLLGDRFPMIGAHKVLAAFSCLVPRIVSGQFDPTRHRAVWPSTGNYARGGVAISRLLGARAVAVLPEHMSRERFDWLAEWVESPADVITTPGSESNIREIYEVCRQLGSDAETVVLNQFCEFANNVGHYTVTGSALCEVLGHLRRVEPDLRLAAFVAASGSSGTLGAGDHLKERHGGAIVAAEPLECPTMLYNGYGEHNIQGIGDKHVPLIHNVMNTDMVTAVSDRATDALNLVFTTEVGKGYLRDRLGVDSRVVEGLRSLGLSSICNLVAAVKAAKYLDLGSRDVILSVATDGSELYLSERDSVLERDHPRGLGEADVAAIVGRYLHGADVSDFEELGAVGRRRVFNLGYYTWVEQQGVSVADFDRRRDPDFWTELHSMAPVWDSMIDDFNAAVAG